MPLLPSQLAPSCARSPRSCQFLVCPPILTSLIYPAGRYAPAASATSSDSSGPAAAAAATAAAAAASSAAHEASSERYSTVSSRPAGAVASPDRSPSRRLGGGGTLGGPAEADGSAYRTVQSRAQVSRRER
jgi:hypothetical protein